jgi:Tfp pilus assembly pilus retraction ATPase PilT
MPLSYSIDDLLEQMVACNASDLHVTTETPPVVRVRGELQRLQGYEPLSSEDTQQLLYRILSSERQKHLEIKRRASASTCTSRRSRSQRRSGSFRRS